MEMRIKCQGNRIKNSSFLYWEKTVLGAECA